MSISVLDSFRMSIESKIYVCPLSSYVGLSEMFLSILVHVRDDFSNDLC